MNACTDKVNTNSKRIPASARCQQLTRAPKLFAIAEFTNVDNTLREKRPPIPAI